MKDDSLLAQTRRLLHRHNIRARKGLGQHFLVDADALPRIISAAELSPDDTVIEVGPGLGILTRELAGQAGRVVAVELDDNLAAILKQALAGCSNVTVINDDILKVDPAALLDGQPYKVVANLPYYITSPVLRHFLEAAVRPQTMVLMVQKEVAEVISAGPGQRSLLSIAVQFYGRPSIVSRVPARSFYPEPEVDSAILKIEVYPNPAVAVADERGFFGLVRAGFAAPRKQLPNSLAQGTGLPKADVLPLLEKAGIALQRRAETLTLEEWAQLWQSFQEREGK
ncbi:MAG: 16S rRNA (adenine(1518)-N(6)/adenine(1519)-N(6))-dimethyltransferase RsmA [Chloroflexota bacterium]